MALDPRRLESLQWRLVGPHRGGRVVAVAGHPTEAMTFYFGACAGGVWKTTDGGTYWENVSDGFFETAAVGALAVAPSDPNVIYAGTGEACIRGNVSHGDGVYRSTDGGRTWVNRGLRDTRHIGRVRVHPSDPDLVYVAALGHAWGPNRERGVFRSRDGGASWQQVLFKTEGAGAVDLCLDAAQSAHPLRRGLAGPAHAVGHVQRRPRLVAVEVDRRRRHLDRHLAQSRAPARGAGADRRRRVAGRRPARLRRDRGRRRRPVPLRRRRRHLAAWKRGAGVARPPLVLHARVRRPRRRRHGVGGRLLAVEVDRRRQDVRRGGHAAWRQPRPLDRSGQPPPDDRGQRRRRLRVVQRRRVVVVDLQPADGAVLPRVRRRPAPLPDLRLPAGQLGDQPAEPVPPGGDRRHRPGAARRRRERVHRGEAGRPQYCRRRLDRHRARDGPPHPLRSPQWSGAHHQRVARAVRHGQPTRRPSLPLPVDVPGLLLALGPARAVDRRQPHLPLDRRGPHVGERERGPHAQRPEQARPVGRPHHARQHRGRGLLHDLRAGRVAARARRAVGRHRRRARPPLARPRQDLAGGDAARSGRVGARQRAGALGPRRGHLLRGRHPLQARRHPPVPVPHGRLRAHVDGYHGRAARGRVHARHPRGPDAPGPPLRRHRERRVGVGRRRRGLAAPAVQPAGGADSRPDREGHRPRGRHPRPRVLDPRRPHPAAPDGGGGARRRCAPVRTAPDGALARVSRPRLEARSRPRGGVPDGGVDRLRLPAGRDADRREEGAAARRRREPAEWRHRPLLAERGARRRRRRSRSSTPAVARSARSRAAASLPPPYR